MHPAVSSGASHGAAAPPSPEEIRGHVARILVSPAFRASKRCHRFLEFIVTQVLEGKASTIKERTLATEVFDRAASWDSGGDDTIVRVGAREVRKRLAQFYSSAEGMQEKIRIELPLGSYVPDFTRLESITPTAILPALTPEPVVILARDTFNKRPWRAIALAGMLVLSLIAYAAFRKRDAFDRFWAPYLHSSEPVLVAIASPVVYSPSLRAYQLNDERWGTPLLPTVRPLKLDPKELNGSDFVPVADEFVAFGDAVAATSIQLLLAKHSKETRVRFASRVEFADFRDGPAILIGAFTNHWTIEMTQHMRFHFGYDAHWVPAILDTWHRDKIWSIPQKQENGSSPEDYFLICRMPSSPSGNTLLIGAGVEQFGTEAAGRFLADPVRMSETLRNISQDWPSKNLEFVMHAKVIGNSPAAPELVSSYVW